LIDIVLIRVDVSVPSWSLSILGWHFVVFICVARVVNVSAEINKQKIK